MLKKAAWGLVCLVLFAGTAAAQDFKRFDASLGFGGFFSKKSHSFGNTVVLEPTPSGAEVFTFRFRFSPRHAVGLNIGHASNSQVYNTSPLVFRVQSGVTEFTPAYFFTPFQTAKFEPFAFGGAGILRFNPGETSIGGSRTSFGAAAQNKLVFTYGGGVDYKVWKAIGVRVQYRGLIYKVPDFRIMNLATGATGHTAEPSAGIVFKF